MTSIIISSAKMTGRSVIASCLSGVSPVSDSALRGTGLSGVSAVRPEPVANLSVLPVREAIERPIQAPAAARAYAYAPAANAKGAGSRNVQQDWATGGFTGSGHTAVTTQHRKMRAFRGLEPWRDPS